MVYTGENFENVLYIEREIADGFIPRIGDTIGDISCICENLSDKVTSVLIQYSDNTIMVSVEPQKIDIELYRQIEMNCSCYGWTYNKQG